MIFYIGVALVVVWLVALTFLVFSMRRHYRRLTTRTKQRSIDDILDTILEKDLAFEKNISSLQKEVQHIAAASKLHYQKVGLVRFNPFDRVGGDQSFVISLLDHENNGIILTFLYTREGVRIWAKHIESGKSGEYELSSEEQEAIKKAK